MVGSLDYNCSAFNTTVKKIKGFDHSIFQDASNDGVLPKFISDNYSKIESYNKYDVIAMAEIT